ncbi:MAG: hypothetical protein M9921_01895 [Fimbriimonadaceae bacterium]|nr:hypothetical protein [Chthonomonadaceae bacterium]MCO5295589.1 hypothetical protein [Fimbriimonadaceae bacterium]
MRVLVTGFGAFGEFEENPSALLAAGCGREHRVLEVAFDAVDQALQEWDPGAFDALLMLGVAGKASAFRVETVARNHIGPAPDVRGEVHGPGPIDPSAPPLLAATLWPSWLLDDTAERAPSVDAGSYLCNYAFFRALQRFPEKRVGFLHVPPASAMALEVQRDVVREVLALLEELPNP